MKPKTGKRPPQGATQVHGGQVVTKTIHDRANFANRILHEINDEDIWEYRDALLNGYEQTAAALRRVLIQRYTPSDFKLIAVLVDWLGG